MVCDVVWAEVRAQFPSDEPFESPSTRWASPSIRSIPNHRPSPGRSAPLPTTGAGGAQPRGGRLPGGRSRAPAGENPPHARSRLLPRVLRGASREGARALTIAPLLHSRVPREDPRAAEAPRARDRELVHDGRTSRTCSACATRAAAATSSRRTSRCPRCRAARARRSKRCRSRAPGGCGPTPRTTTSRPIPTSRRTRSCPTRSRPWSSPRSAWWCSASSRPGSTPRASSSGWRWSSCSTRCSRTTRPSTSCGSGGRVARR